jgi:septal ring factor EnvC (AmiA/AmiB activator)
MKARLTPNFFSVCLFVALLSPFTYAQVPVHREEVFKGLQLDIEKEKKKAQELASQTREEQKKLKALETQIVPIAQKIQKSEQTLIELDNSIKINELKQKELDGILKANQSLLSENFIAALKLKRVPAETLFLQASTPLQTAQTAMLLERTIPQIRHRMDYLSKSAAELVRIKKELDVQRDSEKTELASLVQKQNEIEGLINTRQNLIKKTQKDYQASQNRAAKLSKDAQTLKELVVKIRAENERIRKEEEKAAKVKTVAAVARTASSRPPPMPSNSSGNWPVAGTLKISYGMEDVYGAKSQGIKIETRPLALVTTPMPGIIRFAGPFKNYGEIVIIEHDGGWHSLIGGMSEVNAIVGQTVQNGEPVGKMSSQNDRQGLLLYYELRYKGNPVNPSKKIKGLS